MTTTPRAPDDGRNERQREQQAREMERDHERSSQRDQREGRRDQVPPELREHDEHGNQIARPSDFIERTKPEDRVDRPGQLTRDNVNPAIPSAPPGTGGIVDPNTLGMDQGQQGVPPPPLGNQPEQWPERDPETGQATQPQRAKEPREGELPEGFEPPRLHSINEPPGSNVLPGEGGPNQIPDGAELPPLVLTSIEPGTLVITAEVDFGLTVTGSGFTPNSVIVFDDEELATIFVSQTSLTARPAMATAAAVVDVEVARGEELSDVLTFEFTAVAGTRAKEPERKAKKDTPSHKRPKKGKR